MGRERSALRGSGGHAKSGEENHILLHLGAGEPLARGPSQGALALGKSGNTLERSLLAQQGFYNAGRTTDALRKAGCTEAKLPYWRKRSRTTIWKNTAIKKDSTVLTLSNGKGNRAITIALPAHLAALLRVLEVRLVFDKKARRYTWHVVVENGTQPKAAPGGNVVSVDLGKVHPAVVGDTQEATMITCRERQHEQQGHHKRLSSVTQIISRTTKDSRRHQRLVRAKTRRQTTYASRGKASYAAQPAAYA